MGRIRYISFLTCLISIIWACTGCKQQEEITIPRTSKLKRIVVGTMGASLMYPGNGWVEKACEAQGFGCINKAVSSATTVDFARLLWQDKYATEEELARIDILLIQFANCRNVYGDSTTLLPTADDYTRHYTTYNDELFSEYTYAQQMDYILKKWQQICKNHHKPMRVIFVTHWHDGRVVYNRNVRKLAQRWNAGLCELDKHIGFTKDKPLPDGRQPSLLYAKDTEVINGVLYGWHPLRGKEGEYIQSVMANILQEELIDFMENKW